MAAANSIRGEREACDSEKKEEDEASTAAEEEDEEEALSLSDLPDSLNKQEDRAMRKADSSHQEPQEEFDFLLWGGPFSKESEMCVADEVFFQGQILPLRRKSFGSDATRLLPAGFIRSESSRFESVTTSEFRSSSSSSRSSSIRSQNSSSSSISSTNSIITNPEISKPRIMRNHHQFHTHPSPKPQLKVPSNSRQVSFGHNLNRKSSTWDFFRLGVAPAPEIGLQDLKARCTNNNNNNKNKTCCVSRNSSNSSSDRSSSISNHGGFRQIVGKGGGGFLKGCKCSVETVPFDIMITKKSTKKTESPTHAMKEKAKQKQRKKAMSRHRTFEWIKELSHASYSYNDEEALLLPNP